MSQCLFSQYLLVLQKCHTAAILPFQDINCFVFLTRKDTKLRNMKPRRVVRKLVQQKTFKVNLTPCTQLIGCTVLQILDSQNDLIDTIFGEKFIQQCNTLTLETSKPA